MRRAKGKVKGPRMIHEIHRLSKLGISQRQIANALDVSRNTVKKYLELTNTPSGEEKKYSAPWSGQLDWQVIQLETEKGECLYYLWEERFGENTDNPTVPYVSFWREFKRRYPNIPIDFHKDHPPGERCEVDFKGETTGLGYTDQVTGKFVSCRMFGAILCFSQLLFIRVTEDENIANRILPSLKERCKKVLGAQEKWDLFIDPNESQTIIFSFPTESANWAGSYFKPDVKVEFGAKNETWPTKTAEIESYLSEALPNAIADKVVEVEVLKAERTFWEKATILHALHHGGHSKLRPNQSRHYYDLCRLAQSPICTDALCSIDLLEKVATHKATSRLRRTWLVCQRPSVTR